MYFERTIQADLLKLVSTQLDLISFFSKKSLKKRLKFRSVRHETSRRWSTFCQLSYRKKCVKTPQIIPAWNLRSLRYLMDWFDLLCFDNFFSMCFVTTLKFPFPVEIALLVINKITKIDFFMQKFVRSLSAKVCF